MSSELDDYQFGDLALRLKYLTQGQLDEALDIQEKMRQMGLVPKRMGEICVEKGWLSDAHIQSMLQIQGQRPRAQAQIPGYKVLAKLGKGSMGAVYKARQTAMDRIVAIKTLSPALARDKQFVGRFHREAKSIARLHHENIIAGYEAGEADGIHYFVMEYVDGPTVAEVLQSHGKFGEREALAIVQQICKALEHAHAQNVIHRDLKPDNIMITRQGVAKLCDLGLAKMTDADSSLTAAGMSMGTPHYISPEQARGTTDLDGRTDLYSLGATLFHMVCGRVPFPGSNPVAVMAAHVQEAIPSPRALDGRLSFALERLLRRMMEKDRNDRFQNATELREAIEALLTQPEENAAGGALTPADEDDDLFEDEDAVDDAPDAADEEEVEEADERGVPARRRRGPGGATRRRLAARRNPSGSALTRNPSGSYPRARRRRRRS